MIWAKTQTFSGVTARRTLSWVVTAANCGPLAIHQVIVGGESGKDARPCNVEWLRDLRDQCFDVNLPFFCKQLGSHIINGLSKPPLPPPWPNGAFFDATGRVLLRDSHGGKWFEWPSDLRIRQFPPIR